MSANLKNALSSKASVCGLCLNYIQLGKSLEAGKSERETVGQVLDWHLTTKLLPYQEFLDLRSLTLSIHWAHLLLTPGEQKLEFCFSSSMITVCVMTCTAAVSSLVRVGPFLFLRKGHWKSKP